MVKWFNHLVHPSYRTAVSSWPEFRSPSHSDGLWGLRQHSHVRNVGKNAPFFSLNPVHPLPWHTTTYNETVVILDFFTLSRIRFRCSLNYTWQICPILSLCHSPLHKYIPVKMKWEKITALSKTSVHLWLFRRWRPRKISKSNWYRRCSNMNMWIARKSRVQEIPSNNSWWHQMV